MEKVHAPLVKPPDWKENFIQFRSIAMLCRVSVVLLTGTFPDAVTHLVGSKPPSAAADFLLVSVWCEKLGLTTGTLMLFISREGDSPTLPPDLLFLNPA